MSIVQVEVGKLLCIVAAKTSHTSMPQASEGKEVIEVKTTASIPGVRKVPATQIF